MSLRRWLARTLAPEIAREADRFHRLQYALDEARWWLGNEHPEVASFAQYLIEREAHYWSLGKVEPQAWSPPPWVSEISGYREWLRSRPFAPPPQGRGSEP